MQIFVEKKKIKLYLKTIHLIFIAIAFQLIYQIRVSTNTKIIYLLFTFGFKVNQQMIK